MLHYKSFLNNVLRGSVGESGAMLMSLGNIVAAQS